MIFCSTYSTDILRVWLGNACKNIVGAVRPSSNVGYYYTGDLNKMKNWNKSQVQWTGHLTSPLQPLGILRVPEAMRCFCSPKWWPTMRESFMVNIAGAHIHMVEQGEFCYPLAFCKSLKYQCWPLGILQNAFFECISKENIMKQSKMIFLVLWILGMQKET